MENKYSGKKETFVPVRQDGSCVYISYEKEDVDDVFCTWYEQHYYKKQHPYLSIDEVKEDVLADINSHITERITSGFVWNGKNVWLSAEYQRDFADAQQVTKLTDGANLPLKLKLGEDENGNPVYHTFTKQTSMNDFYLSMVVYIQKCREDGWALKDSIDWQQMENDIENMKPWY